MAKPCKINPMRITLVGLGHEMHGDDEIGLEVLRRWSEEHAGEFRGLDIRTTILESPGINLLGSIAGLDAAILVAAVRSGAPAGTVRVFKDEELAAFESSGIRWGAAATLSLGRQLAPEDMPEKLVLVGIEGAAFSLGEGLSPAVRAAIPDALRALDQILGELARKSKPIRGIINRVGRLLGLNTS